MGLFGTNTMNSSAEVMDSNPVQAWIFFRPYFTTVKITLIFTFLSAVHMIYIDSHSFIYHFKSLLVTNITTSSLLALTQLVELQWYCRCHGFKSLTHEFFSGLIFTTAQVVFITAEITFVFKGLFVFIHRNLRGILRNY